MTKKQEQKSRGTELMSQLDQAMAAEVRAPLPGARDVPVLAGVDHTGSCTPLVENVLLEAIEILKKSTRVFWYGHTVSLERRDSDGVGRDLLPLCAGNAVEPYAASYVANIFVCEDEGAQFAPPQRFIKMLLHSELLKRKLPIIHIYASRPIFDSEFQLRAPGWHADAGILIHGPAVDVVPFQPTTQGPLIDRLPHHLRNLLAGFCWLADADLANAVAMLLTGFLVQHFIEHGKPIGLIDGNQPSVGKTLLARTFGMVLDGECPLPVAYTPNDEELGKRICAKLRGGLKSVLVIDNAKTPEGAVISSPEIEANSTAPEIAMRILGVSRDYRRPNDVLWFLTMNDTKAAQDLLDRGVPIRLHFVGTAAQRTFPGCDPVEYAREHRVAILGELAGLVTFWNARGRPQGVGNHRLQQWVDLIGGILHAVGFAEFLTNVADAATSFDAGLDELAALAEAAVRQHGSFYVVTGEPVAEGACGAEASFWTPVFGTSGVRRSQIEGAASAHAKSVVMGKYLANHVGRPVPIRHDGRDGVATLHETLGRSRRKIYHFEIQWAAADGDDGSGPQGHEDRLTTVGRGQPHVRRRGGPSDDDAAFAHGGGDRQIANAERW